MNYEMRLLLRQLADRNDNPLLNPERLSKNTRGQTLVEAIIALTVLVIIITSIAIITINSINNSVYLRNQDAANKYAQEGMDFLSTQKKQDYSQLSSIINGNYCLTYDINRVPQWPLGSAPCFQSSTGFSHEVNIQQGGCPGTGIQVTMTVGWTDAKCIGGAYCHRARVQTCFTNSNIINPNPVIVP